MTTETDTATITAVPFYGRIEMPGWRQHTGWISEETRFGVAAAVVRLVDDPGATPIGVVYPGPGCRIIPLPPPPDGEPRALAAPDDVVDVVVHAADCDDPWCKGECERDDG